jgi:type I restriction enzyme, R subunit
MLGRGTRKGEHFTDKSHFVVFDCFDGTLLDYFKNATGITAEAPLAESRTIVQIINDIWQNRDRDYNIRCLVKRLHRINKQMSGDARDLFAAYILNGDMGRFAADLPQSLRQDFTHTMSILRDPHFQNLLINYPRAQRTFVVAYETRDTVTSTYLIRDVAGNQYQLADYITECYRFVEENTEQIEAIRIWLDRPRDSSIDALNELRQKLAAAPLHFTLDNLQKAHEWRYHKSLVDIISMIKHAAREEAPLYTAQERVELALSRVIAGRSFTAKQQAWLDRIKGHLVENLTIDEEDFDAVPVFTRAGGWTRANRVFDNQLSSLVQEFNEEIAA